jgi:hypothetical protein
MKTKGLIRLTRSLVLMVLFVPLLLSCYTYKSITKNKPVTREVLSELETGKTYTFELRTGFSFRIYVESVETDTIVGYAFVESADGKEDKMRYSEGFENLIEQVAKISLWKHNPYLTSTLVAVAAFTTAFLIWVAAWTGV